MMDLFFLFIVKEIINWKWIFNSFCFRWLKESLFLSCWNGGGGGGGCVWGGEEGSVVYWF